MRSQNIETERSRQMENHTAGPLRVTLSYGAGDRRYRTIGGCNDADIDTCRSFGDIVMSTENSCALPTQVD